MSEATRVLRFILLAVFPAIASLICGPVWAADAIDGIVRSEMQRQSSPAVGLAVVKDGRIVKASGYGLANVEHGAAATGRTFFQTASVGKQFTAALVLLLVRDGRIGLDDPIAKHLKDTPPAWQSITIRQLLSHTSGLVFTDPAIDLRRDYTEQELLTSAYRLPLASAPGSRHAYSDLGYQVLGVLCSQVGGRFYGEQMHERLFKPLGMNARVISERDIVPRRAAGYDRFDGKLENQAWVAPSQNTTADGSLYVTPLDMARWARALDARGLLTRDELETLWKPTTLADGTAVDYGLGWALFTEGDHRLVRHRGDWQGFTSHILHLPEDRLTIVVLMNRARGQPHVIADRIAVNFIPALRKPKPLAPTAAQLGATPLFVRMAAEGWQASTPLLQVGPGLLRARVTFAAGMQQFKIGAAHWAAGDLGAWYDEAVVRLNKPQRLAHQGEHLFFEAAAAGDYDVELNLHAGKAPTLKLSATAPAKP